MWVHFLYDHFRVEKANRWKVTANILILTEDKWNNSR